MTSMNRAVSPPPLKISKNILLFNWLKYIFSTHSKHTNNYFSTPLNDLFSKNWRATIFAECYWKLWKYLPASCPDCKWLPLAQYHHNQIEQHFHWHGQHFVIKVTQFVLCISLADPCRWRMQRKYYSICRTGILLNKHEEMSLNFRQSETAPYEHF